MRWDKVEIGQLVLEKKSLNFIKCIFAISTLSLLEKRRTQHLNELKSYFNLTRGFFVLSMVEIGPVFLCQGFRFFSWSLSLLGKGHDSYFEESWIPFTQGDFVLCLVEIDSVVLEKKTKCEKFTTTTDKFRSEKSAWAFSSGEL